MQRKFDSGKFVSRIGQDLVREFDSARQATTPELVGDAMEQPVRDRLEQILPRGIAVGSGCVIDTNGGTSRQMDVILYERDICPVFCINNSPETTYYPCEGVIAVGEVKSVVGAKEIKESFEKISSVKSLLRDFDKKQLPKLKGKTPYSRITRNYGQVSGPSIVNMVFDPESHEPSRDVFGFILADRMAVKENTMFGHYAKLVDEYGSASPNIVVFLDGNLFNAFDLSANQGKPSFSINKGNSVGRTMHANPFSNLVRWIYMAYHSIQTPGIAVFGKYFSEEVGTKGVPLFEHEAIKMTKS